MVARIDKRKIVMKKKIIHNLLKQKTCIACFKFFTNVRLSDPGKSALALLYLLN